MSAVASRAEAWIEIARSTVNPRSMSAAVASRAEAWIGIVRSCCAGSFACSHLQQGRLKREGIAQAVGKRGVLVRLQEKRLALRDGFECYQLALVSSKRRAYADGLSGREFGDWAVCMKDARERIGDCG